MAEGNVASTGTGVDVVGTGMKAGSAGAGAMVTWTRADYERKIAELEGYNTRLNTHLQNLQGLQARIPSFWDDDNAATVIQTLSKEIVLVQQASDRVVRLKSTYEQNIIELEQSGSVAGSLLSNALQMVQGLD